jgi:hypothetical protein
LLKPEHRDPFLEHGLKLAADNEVITEFTIYQCRISIASHLSASPYAIGQQVSSALLDMPQVSARVGMCLPRPISAMQLDVEGA